MKKTTSYIIIALLALAAVGYLLVNSSNQQPPLIIERGAVVDGEGEVVDESLVKIVAVGDSLTAGYNLPLSDTYPMILEKKLQDAGGKVAVINAGISGETTAGLLERAEFISEQKPDILLISTGGNDALRSLSVEKTKENITSAIKIFKQSIRPENIYLLQIETTANLGLGYRQKFNGIYKEIAKSEKVNLLPFVVREVFLDSSKMLSDSIHPNQAGYEYIVDKYIFPALSERLLLD